MGVFMLGAGAGALAITVLYDVIDRDVSMATVFRAIAVVLCFVSAMVSP